ncbi:MAG TPA: serine/threonine-protein kinase [Anaerolineales bacterium]|nr:serine/threonine-protein kinase [Anaerolineales bacterium]
MDQLQPGQMLGPYRIISQIGQGGMATVYKAYQPSMDRNVAVKVLPGQLAQSAEFTQRFQQEARIIARLEHAHILPVFDYGESEGIAYFVMRFLDAGTLKDKMETGRPLSLSEIDRLFTQLADALSYAHSQGVVHRDLKPANALIDSRGNLFLTDFGIAKILESASPRLTQTDAIMGTPAYISPEQAQAQKVDQRSDIYSLGIILYEMVTGRVPYTADTPLAVILKHVTHPLPLPSSVKPDIPEPVERLLLKALAKNPGDRFATVSDFLTAWKIALDAKDSSPEKFDALTAITSAPAMPPHSGTVQTQSRAVADAHQGATVSEAFPKSEKPKRSIVGYLVGGFLLLAVAGIAAIAFNWNKIPFFNQRGTDTGTEPENVSPLIPGEATTQEFASEIGDEIKNGEPEAGAGLLEAPGSKDIYTFTAESGEAIYIHIIEPPATADNIEFYMTDDLGSNVFSSCLQCGDPGVITLDRGGEYKLTVGNNDPNGAGYGAYRIKLWEVPPPDAFEINLDEPISRDAPDEGAGYIESPGARDEYTFTAESGQAVYFQVSEPPKTNDSIYWRVSDVAGNVIFNTCLQCGDPGLQTLESGGVYTITVDSANSHGTGAYGIKAWSVPPPNEFEIQIGDTVSRDDPGPGAGLIEAPGAHDIYTFTATAGQTVAFKVLKTPNTGTSIYWRLEDEAGNELFNTCLDCGDFEPITFDHDGTYTIIVGSENSPGLGTYEFQLIEQ